MKGAVMLVGLALLMLVMTSCGMGKAKFVGKYVCWESGATLELKPDGTYIYEIQGFLGKTTTGEWSVEKEDGHEIVSFLGGGISGPGPLERSKKTGNLISIFGQTFVKQD